MQDAFSPYRRLAVAVLLQAYHDARKPNGSEARAFLLGGQSLHLWAAWLGLKEDAIRWQARQRFGGRR